MQIADDIRDKIEFMLSKNPDNMGKTLGIEFTSFAKDELTATMPVDHRTIQPFGILHGGASVALAETLASIGAWLNLDDENLSAVGLDINANHIRPVPEGNHVKATAKPIHRGSQTQVWEVRITTDAGKLVCISRCTLAIIKRRKS
jgi:1,4-dihydroxy-2-naphthoyl-CoA hydrolase